MSIQNNTTGLSTLKDLINALPEYIDTTGTAVAADIYSGKTATVGGVKLTGTNPYNAANVDPAVADAITALTDKGVDATGAGLADLAGLIAGIESGATFNGSPVLLGTFTLAETPSYSSIAIPINLEEIFPDGVPSHLFAICWKPSYGTNFVASKNVVSISFDVDKKTFYTSAYSGSSALSMLKAGNVNSSNVISHTEVQFYAYATATWEIGVTYCYLVMNGEI